MSGFDITRSRISDDTLAAFLATPIDQDLMTVPGIGEATVTRLKEGSVTTTFQLIGAFLCVCGKDQGSDERTNAFWFYLEALNVPGGTRSTIVHSIAERVNIMMPGIYDPSH